MENINLDKTKQIIAKQLKFFRKKNNETQKDVIENIGSINLSERSYKSYENGTEEHLPSLDKLMLLANHFNIPVDTLISGKTYTDDESYNWESTMKRLNRLIYTMVLNVRINNKKNKKFKYYFEISDKLIEIYIDDILNFCKKKNYNLYRNSQIVKFTPRDFDKLIGGFAKDKRELVPGPHRFEEVINNMGSTMKDWIKIRNSEAKNY